VTIDPVAGPAQDLGEVIVGWQTLKSTECLTYREAPKIGGRYRFLLRALNGKGLSRALTQAQPAKHKPNGLNLLWFWECAIPQMKRLRQESPESQASRGAARGLVLKTRWA
jgi:hypothetical protein